MGLIRLITIALIVYLVIVLLKRWSASTQKRPQTPPTTDNETMVRCEVCRLHVPQRDALQKSGKYYCCQKHLEQD